MSALKGPNWGVNWGGFLVAVFIGGLVIVYLNNPGPEGDLMLAVKRNDTNAVAKILLKKNLANSRGPSGRTPLMLAAEKGHVEMILLLLKEGADPRLVDGRGKTALDYAIQFGQTNAQPLLGRPR